MYIYQIIKKETTVVVQEPRLQYSIQINKTIKMVNHLKQLFLL